MTLQWPNSGMNWFTAYHVPGVPWVTGSVSISLNETKKMELSHICKYFSVRNLGASDLRVGFTLNGVTGSNFMTVPTGTIMDFDLRVRDVYLLPEDGSTTFDFLAGLTNISRNAFPDISGSTSLQGTTGSNYQFVPNIG